MSAIRSGLRGSPGAAGGGSTNAVTAAACAAWALVHLLVATDGLWGQPLSGEWDILVGAVAVAQGEPLDLSLGAIRPNESGSALVSWLIAPFIALGLAPEAAGRLAAMLYGVSLVGFATHWAGTRAKDPWAAGVTGGLLGVGWCALHLHTIGVLGTSVQALLPLLIAARSVLDTRRLAGWAVAGALSGLAVLLSTSALPVAALFGGVSILRARAVERGWLAPVLFAVSALGAFLLPFALSGLGGRLLHWLVEGWSAQFFSAKVGGVFQWVALEVLRVWPAGLVGDFVPPGPATAVVYGAAVAFPFGLLLVAWRSPAGRGPALLALLVSLSVFGIPPVLAVYPNAFRHWMLPVLLGAVGFGVAAAPFARRRPALVLGALGVLGVASTITLPKVLPVPPPRAFAFAHFGGHRCQDRPLPPELSKRHGTVRRLLAYIPEEDRAAVLEGYGLTQAVDYASWYVDDPEDAWPHRLLGELNESLREAWFRGVGCGLGAFGALDPRAEEHLSEALAEPAVAAARALCGGDPGPQDSWGYSDLPVMARDAARDARQRHTPVH